MGDVMWEQLRYDIELAFEGQMKNMDLAWGLTEDLGLCE